MDILTGGRTALSRTTRQIDRFSSYYLYSAVKRLLICTTGNGVHLFIYLEDTTLNITLTHGATEFISARLIGKAVTVPRRTRIFTGSLYGLYGEFTGFIVTR